MIVFAIRVGCVPRLAYEAMDNKSKTLGGETIYHGASSDGYDISIAAPSITLLERMCAIMGVRYDRRNVYTTLSDD